MAKPTTSPRPSSSTTIVHRKVAIAANHVVASAMREKIDDVLSAGGGAVTLDLLVQQLPTLAATQSLCCDFATGLDVIGPGALDINRPIASAVSVMTRDVRHHTSQFQSHLCVLLEAANVHGGHFSAATELDVIRANMLLRDASVQFDQGIQQLRTDVDGINNTLRQLVLRSVPGTTFFIELDRTMTSLEQTLAAQEAKLLIDQAEFDRLTSDYASVIRTCTQREQEHARIVAAEATMLQGQLKAHERLRAGYGCNEDAMVGHAIPNVARCHMELKRSQVAEPQRLAKEAQRIDLLEPRQGAHAVFIDKRML